MAKGHVIISGKIGPVVACFIKANNSIRYRAHPRKYKTTTPVKKRRTTFGRASTWGRLFRKRLISILPFPKDKSMQGKFSGAMTKWITTTAITELQPVQQIPFLHGFQFNEATSLEARWKVDIEMVKNAEGNFILRIPSFIPKSQIVAPAGTVSVECRIAAAGFMLENNSETGRFEEITEFPLNDDVIAAREISLGINSQPGSMVICGIYLIYKISGKSWKTETDNPKFMPAGVVGAVYC